MQVSKIIIIEDEFFAATHLSKLVTALGFEVVNIYYSGEDFFSETDWNFDAAIVDIFLAEDLTGIEVAKELNKKKKPFIFLTANQDSETLKNAIGLAPSAYLTKPFKENDVEAALTILSQQSSQKEVNPYFVFLQQNKYSNAPFTLKEIEVMQCVYEGLTNSQISDKLFVSLSTIKTHISNIFQKFNIKSRSDLKTLISKVIR
jgi:DNA-binding NarL/FixJ family response regulator